MDEFQYGSEGETKDQVVARLAKLSPIEFDQAKEAAAAALGCTVGNLTREVKAYQKRQPKQEAPPLDIDALAESAVEIIECDDVLGLFEADWSRLIAGEQRIGKLLLLAGTSRLFDKAINVAIKGSSAGGKSEVRKQALKFFPPESIISFTSLSERALIYTEDDYQHKILSMGEAAGTDEQGLQDYLLRELMSEGALQYQTAQKVGNDIQTIKIEKHGPVAFMVTTTKRKLHPENETRMLSLDIDDSEIQTRAVLKKIAENEGSNAGHAPVDFKPWQDFQRWLEAGECMVVVPYADALADAIPPRSVRLRRDFGQVLHAIKAHALLHREHRARQADGTILANIDQDYAAVRDLMHDLLAESSEVKVKETVIETTAAVLKLTKGTDENNGTTAKAVGKELKLDKSAAYRRLAVAEDSGFVINLENKRGRPGKYRTTGEQVEAIDMMPTIKTLKVLSPDAPHATTQPDNQNGFSTTNQGDRGCKPARNQGCNQSLSQVVASAVAHPPATTKTRKELPKTEQRLHGCTVATEGAGKDDADDHEPEADPDDPSTYLDDSGHPLSPETREANRLLGEVPPQFERRPSRMTKSSI
jgi:hypothetical protein